jgi:hypothetical protein
MKDKLKKILWTLLCVLIIAYGFVLGCLISWIYQLYKIEKITWL